MTPCETASPRATVSMRALVSDATMLIQMQSLGARGALKRRQMSRIV